MEYEPDPFADEEPTSESRPDHIKRLVVRMGLGFLAVGFVVAAVGVSQRARTGDMPGTMGQTVHHVGKAFLLLGLFAILVAHRIRSFLEMSNMSGKSEQGDIAEVPVQVLVGQDDGSTEVMPQVQPSLAHRHGRRPVAANLVSLLGVVLICLLMCLIVSFVPNNLAGVVISFFIPLMTVGMVIAIIYGTTVQRTFCIGAIVPWSAIVIQYLIFWSTMFPRWGGRGTRWRGSFFGWLVRQATELLGALDGFGASIRFQLLIVLSMTLVCGFFAILVRTVIHGINADRN